MDEERVKRAFGNALAQERKSRGYSQEKLAFEANIDRSFLSEIEQGTSQPTLITLWKLCGALGVSPSALIARTEALSV